MRLLSRDDLKAKGIPYCRQHLDRLEGEGKFPKHVKPGENRVAWLEDEIDAYIAGLRDARDAPPAAPVSPRKRGRHAKAEVAAETPKIETPAKAAKPKRPASGAHADADRAA